MKDWILKPEKYLKEEDVRKLRRLLEEKSIVALAKKQKKPIRDRTIIELALQSGLRVSELSNIKIKHLYLKKGESALYVAHSKADKHRVVHLPDKLRKHLRQHLVWKKAAGESTKPDSYLFISERSDHMTPWAMQKVFKTWARAAGLDHRYSIHCARHTYGTMLYRATKDLRLVQKQLGHSSSQITEIYADVLASDAQAGVNKIFAEVG